MQDLVVSGQHPPVMFRGGRHAAGGVPCEGAELVAVAREKALDRGSAGDRVAGPVRLPAGGVDGVCGSARIGHDDRETARDRLGDAEPERLVRAAVHQEVGAREGLPESAAVALEALEAHTRGRRALECRALRSVAEEDEHRLPPPLHPTECLEHHVPPLLECEATDPDEKGGAVRRAAEELVTPLGAACSGVEGLHVHAEGSVDDALDACRAKPIGLPPSGDEGGVERSEQRPDPSPHRSAHGLGHRHTQPSGKDRLDVRSEVVGVPERGPNPGSLSPAGSHGGRAHVRGMGFEDVRTFGPDECSYLVEPTEQVVGAIVGEGRPRHAHHSCARSLLGGANERGLVFIPWARRNHHVVVAQLAQKVTSGRQMASNPATPFRIEFSDVDDLHAKASNAGLAAEPGRGVAPLAALAARQGRPLRVAILSDFTRISYANGAVFQTRFLYQELRRCGHEVTVIGPHDPDAAPDELAPGTVSIPSVPLRAYPGVHVPLPLAGWVFDTSRWNFDICFAQTTSMLLEFGVWLREMMGVPLLCVNTTHLVAAYDVLLPEKLSKNNMFQAGVHLALKRPFERIFANIYNQSDGLVVLSEGLRAYWSERGVTAPIHVIPRAVQPDVFDRPLGPDPYTHLIEREKLPQRGARLLCAGRHTREKSPDRVIRVFAEHVLPQEPDATLTLVGEGPETEYCRRLARELGAEHHVFFTSEVPWTSMPDYYRYADVFVHASLSETYGNVLGEALWCGTPTVAFADGMGASAQITDGQNGVLFAPGNGPAAVAAADAAFGRAVVELIRDPKARARLSTAAARRARERSSPVAVQQRLADAFESAQDHAVASGLRPAVDRPRMMRWLSTLRHARPWTTFNGLIYLSGRLRPTSVVKRGRIHPGIGEVL